MNVNTVSNGERMWLNSVTMQAQRVLRANQFAACDMLSKTTTSGTDDRSIASENTTKPNVAISKYSISPVDKNGDGKISRDEFHGGINNARQLLATLHSSNAKIRAFEAQSSVNAMPVKNEEMAVSA